MNAVFDGGEFLVDGADWHVGWGEGECPSMEEQSQKLRRMRVKNFRCIEDSTEFSVSPVTAFVGKNGAGKTSLLEALYKLNPDVEELANFDVLMEYPRARRREYQKQPHRDPDDALITTWELEDKDVEKLVSILGSGAVKSRTVVIEKGYYPGRRWTGSLTGIGASVGRPVIRAESAAAQTVDDPDDRSRHSRMP
jgi:hypothetical protein